MPVVIYRDYHGYRDSRLSLHVLKTAHTVSTWREALSMARIMASRF